MRRKVLASFVVLFLTLVVLELIVRSIGYVPYQLPEFSFISEPSWCFDKDSLGVVPKPGTYQVNLNGLKHAVTHTESGNRITRYYGHKEDTVPQIFVYGCSYPYGQGVNDNETYPFLLQKMHPNQNVINLSRPGYGTIQAMLHLKNTLSKKSVLPHIIVLNYAAFHEERNVLADSYIYKLYMGYQLMNSEPESMVYPRAILSKDSVHVEYQNIVEEFNPLPLRNQSALVNLLDRSLAFSQIDKLKTLTSTKRILIQIQRLCNAHGMKLVVADIELGEGSETIKNFCESIELDYVDISPVFSDGSYRNLPYDNHPNAKAHSVYAQKLSNFLNDNKLLR